MDTIVFLILHYGEISVTKTCTDSILQLDSSANVHIVIVDNDYMKPEQERYELKRQYDSCNNVDIIVMEEDCGFSKANNTGYIYAKQKYDPDYMIISNNDIVFEQDDFVEKLIDINSNGHYAILSPDVINANNGQHQSPIDTKGRSLKQVGYTIRLNEICLKIFPIVYPLLKANYVIQKRQSASNEVVGCQEDVVPYGACIVLTRFFMDYEEKVFFPETHFYYEEYILYERCKKKKYRIQFNPEIQVFHWDGVATRKKSKNDRKKIRFVMEETLKAAKVYKELIQERD